MMHDDPGAGAKAAYDAYTTTFLMDMYTLRGSIVEACPGTEREALLGAGDDIRKAGSIRNADADKGTLQAEAQLGAGDDIREADADKHTLQAEARVGTLAPCYL